MQPCNRGTAAGVLLPLFAVLARDREARIALFPSDHHVQSEGTLRIAIQQALEGIRDGSGEVALLGMTPDAAVSDYGWILPEPGPGRLRRVQRFVEKPEPPVCAELLADGGPGTAPRQARPGRASAPRSAGSEPAGICSMGSRGCGSRSTGGPRGLNAVRVGAIPWTAECRENAL